MNRIAIYLFCTLTFLCAGCELANDNVFDNPDFDVVNVNGMAPDDEYLTVLQFETLQINPEISGQADESNLSYEWTVRTDERFINDSIDEEVTVISNEKNLEYYVTLVTGDWKFVCRVTDETTGVTSVGYFYVTVQNQFSEGWLVLEEIGDIGDLSIILPDGSIFNGIYSDINPNNPLETPLRQLVVTNFPYGTDEIAILSENGGIQLDYSELLRIADIRQLFWTAPEIMDPEHYEWHGASNGWVINNGKVHLQVRGGFPGDKKYGSVMAFPGDIGSDYNVAPFVAAGPSFGAPYPAVLYDNQGKFFVYLASGLSPLLRHFPTSPDGAPFDMNDVGLEMVYMEESNEQYLTNAVMKDDNDKYYMLQFRATEAEPAESYTEMTVPDIANHTAFESSQTLERMYYSVGNQIYLYDIPSGLIIGSPLALDGGENITNMEIHGSEPSVMMVATWDGTEGHIYELNLAGTGEASVSEKYSGFGKIIDLDYKD